VHPYAQSVEQFAQGCVLPSREVEINGVKEAVCRIVERSAERGAGGAEHDLAQAGGHGLRAKSLVGDGLDGHRPTL